VLKVSWILLWTVVVVISAIFCKFGKALGFFGGLTFGVNFGIFNLFTFHHPVMFELFVILGLFDVAVGRCAAHVARILRGVFRLVVERKASHGHNSNVLLNVVLRDKVANVVFLSDGVFFISLLSLLDCRELCLGKSADLA